MIEMNFKTTQCQSTNLGFFHTCKKNWINKSLFTNINLIAKNYGEGKQNLNIMVCRNTNGHRRTLWFDRTLGVTLKNKCVVSILCQWPTLMTPIQKARLQITY